jgi:hypothetical protein
MRRGLASARNSTWPRTTRGRIATFGSLHECVPHPTTRTTRGASRTARELLLLVGLHKGKGVLVFVHIIVELPKELLPLVFGGELENGVVLPGLGIEDIHGEDGWPLRAIRLLFNPEPMDDEAIDIDGKGSHGEVGGVFFFGVESLTGFMAMNDDRHECSTLLSWAMTATWPSSE